MQSTRKLYVTSKEDRGSLDSIPGSWGKGHVRGGTRFAFRVNKNMLQNYLDCPNTTISDPKNAQALHQLAMLRCGEANYESARALMEKAIETEPENYLYHYSLGEICRGLCQFADAVECYEKAIVLHPDFFEAHNNLGVVFQELGLLDAAVRSYKHALLIAPDSVRTLVNLGIALVESHRHDEGAACFKRVIGLDPDFIEAYEALCDTFLGSGRLSDEMARYRQALQPDQSSFTVLSNLGAVLQERGHLEEALDTLGLAVQLDPRSAQGYNDFGSVQMKLGRDEEAFESFQKAVALDHDFVRAHDYLGVLCYNRGLFADAKRHLETTVRLKDTHVTGCINLGMLLVEEGFLDEGCSYYERADTISPNVTAKVRRATALPVIPRSSEEILSARGNLERSIDALLNDGLMVDDPLQHIGKINFYCAYHGLNDRAIQTKLAGFYERICPSLRFVAPHCRTKQGSARRNRLKIGFVSRHLKDHTVGKYVRGIIANMDRHIFEVHSFMLPHGADEISEFIEGHSDAVTLVPESLPAARKLISDSKLDILFYPDIGMEPFTYFLAFSRLAPVQCVFYGHPITTGIGNVDYFISHEDCECEEADEHYSERLVRLSRKAAYAYYYRPSVGEHTKGRADFGVPESAHVYLCSQSLFKIHPDFDEILNGILHRDEKATVVFIHGLHPSWSQLLATRLQGTLGDAMGRVHFLARQAYEDYLDLLAVADVVLDTVHFNGGATTFDALAVGTPIVTMPGRFMRGRQTYALYKRMGVMDCIAATPEQYIDIAVRVGSDPLYRASIKSKILAGNSVIFEDIEMVRELERHLIAMVERK